MKKLTIFLLFLWANAVAQEDLLDLDSAFILDSSIHQVIDLANYTQFFVDEKQSYALKDIKSKVQEKIFSPLSELKYQGRFKDGGKYYWLYFQIKNSTKDTLEGYLSFGTNDTIQIWQDTESHQLTYLNGQKVYERWAYPKVFLSDKYVTKIKILPLKKQVFYVRLNNLLGQSTIKNRLYPIATPDATTLLRFFQIQFFNGLFLGIVFFIFLLTLIQYFINKDAAYGYYAAYLLFVLLKFKGFIEALEVFGLSYLKIITVLTHYDGPFLAISTYIFYMIFVEQFLEAKTKLPRLYQVTRFGIYILGIYLVFNILLLFFKGPHTAWMYFNNFRFILAILAVYMLYLVLKAKNRLAFFVLTGTILLLLGGLITMVLPHIYRDQFYYQIDFTKFGVQLGILLDILFFSTGLAYKARMVATEKSKIQDELIAQLQKNQQLKEKVTQNLKTKLQILKSQLKPHFIFNCMASIKSLIIKNKKDAAEVYLLRFSDLMRETLRFSDKEQVSLKEELLFAENYLELEKMRFRDKFTYSIQEGTVLTSEIKLPPMILQPFLENAIQHGLLPKEGDRELIISIKEQNQAISCSIQDNGIGRKEAAKLAEQSLIKKHRESKGIAIIKEQLHSYNEYFQTNIQLSIEDLKDAKGNASGTKVNLLIPLFNNQLTNHDKSHHN